MFNPNHGANCATQTHCNRSTFPAQTMQREVLVSGTFCANWHVCAEIDTQTFGSCRDTAFDHHLDLSALAQAVCHRKQLYFSSSCPGRQVGWQDSWTTWTCVARPGLFTNSLHHWPIHCLGFRMQRQTVLPAQSVQLTPHLHHLHLLTIRARLDDQNRDVILMRKCQRIWLQRTWIKGPSISGYRSQGVDGQGTIRNAPETVPVAGSNGIKSLWAFHSWDSDPTIFWIPNCSKWTWRLEVPIQLQLHEMVPEAFFKTALLVAEQLLYGQDSGSMLWPSLGSATHALGICKPCDFQHRTSCRCKAVWLLQTAPLNTLSAVCKLPGQDTNASSVIFALRVRIAVARSRSRWGWWGSRVSKEFDGAILRLLPSFADAWRLLARRQAVLEIPENFREGKKGLGRSKNDLTFAYC